MIVLSFVATVFAIVWSIFVVCANGMSDAPQDGFRGGWMIGAAWFCVAVMWLGWWIG